jgi:peptidoglycan hydrolase CwlO-like protein
MMNGKKIFKVILCFNILPFLFSACCTNRNIADNAADVINRNSHAAGQLEATVAALDTTVSSSRERIENIIATSRNIADGIERVEYLFGQYENEIDRLLNEIDGIRSEIEVEGENNTDSSNSTDSLYTR